MEDSNFSTKNKILVLGATGNVGIPLVHLLKKHNANFCIGIKHDSILPESMKAIKSVYLDYNEPSSLENAFAGVHTVFILIPDSPLMVNHATNIKNAILINNVFRYIYLGGLGSKLAPDTWLSKNLAECEKIFASIGISGTVLRPTFFMQNLLNHYPPDSENRLSLPVGEGKVNYIDAHDVAFAVYELLVNDESNKYKEVNLTGKDSFSMEKIVGLLSEVVGKSYRYNSTSFSESRQAMKEKGLPEWLINMLLQIYEKVRENCYEHSTGDFRQITGKDPESLRSFIKKNQDSFN